MRQQRGEARRALDQGPRADVFTVEIQKIEQKKHQPGGVPAIRRGLDHAERCDAVGAHAAQLGVEIGLLGRERRHRRGDRRVFMRPVEPGAGEQTHGAAIEARMYAVAVEFDLVQPLGPVRRLVDELSELRT